jgi:polar amino acid transport system permease protein
MLDKLYLLGFGEGGWGLALLQGAGITISIALATLPFGLLLGLIVALAKRSDNIVWRWFATVYTTVFRGVPELLTLYIIYFGVQVLLQKVWSALGLPGNFEMPPFVAGMVALGVVLSAFSSEVWVGALNSIQKGQREAAAALGLSKAKTFRLVVFPQLMRVALPGLGNNWMVLLKETSLVSVITLPDIMFYATRANVATKEPFLFFGAAMLIYLFFSLISAWLFDRLEIRGNRGQAAFGGAMK